MPRSDEDATAVLAFRAGDPTGFDVLFRRWSDRCFDVARRITRDDRTAAEVTQEVFLRAWRDLDSLRDPAAFGGWVLRASRNRALDRLDHERRSTTTADDDPIVAHRTDPDDVEGAVEAAMTAQQQREILDAAAAVLGERDASVLDLALRHGFGPSEIAEVLGVTTNNANQVLHRMRNRLGAGIRAWVLYRGGDHRCEVLSADLAAAGVISFGRDAMRVVDDHVAGCDDCESRRAAVLAPEAMFTLAPIAVIGPDLRNTIVEALRAEGAPMGPHIGAPDASGDLPMRFPPRTPRESPGGEVGGDRLDRVEMTADDAREPDAALTRRRAALVLTVVGVVILGALFALRPTDESASGPVQVALPTAATTLDEPTSTSVHPTGTAATTIASTTTAPATSAGVSPTEAVASTFGPLTEPLSPAPPESPQAPPPQQPGSFTPRSTTTQPPPAPVSIDSFTAVNTGGPELAPCTFGQWRWKLTWTTTGATAVSAGPSAGPLTDGLPTDGSTYRCLAGVDPPAGGWLLHATGPGGTDTASA